MENPKDQATARLKESTNVLVTVSNNPSVDQLAAAIGLTLMLNKLGKHATAVFSGRIPSTIEFLQPENTLKKNTDSLRDFIIALDKSKADKLRYKVEDQHVKIFITPYHTSIGKDDLEFSQGDFNVDTVVALGVRQQQDLDQAIVAHGRILHDATIISVNTGPAGDVGSIAWTDGVASSLCEMVAGIGDALQPNIFDAQMSTALLTGVVAETERFSNQKTSAATMSLSAKLMAAGANQQLVATKLQEGAAIPATQIPAAPKAEGKADGSLSIDHPEPAPVIEDQEEGDSDPDHQIHIDDHGTMRSAQDAPTETPIHDRGIVPPPPPRLDAGLTDTSRIVTEPPTLGGTLTANAKPVGLDTPVDQMTLPPVGGPLLSHDGPAADEPPAPPPISPTPVPDPVPTPPASQPAPSPTEPSQTLEDIEKAVDSPHQGDEPEAVSTPDLDSLRLAVDSAAASGPDNALPKPLEGIGATPVDLPLGDTAPEPNAPNDNYLDVNSLDEKTGLPSNLVPPDPGLPADNTGTLVDDPSAPPPVPPPMMPPTQSEPLFGQQSLPNAEDDNDPQDPLTAI